LQLLSQEFAQLAEELQLEGLFLADDSGYIIAASDWDAGLTHLGESFDQGQHFQDAMANGTGEQFGVDTVNGQPRFFFSVRKQHGATVQGVVVLATSSDRLVPLLRDSEEHILITDAWGVVVASSQDEWMYRAMAGSSVEDMDPLDAGLRYGRTKFLDLPPHVMADETSEVVDAGTIHVVDYQDDYNSHVVLEADNLDQIRRDNLIMTVGLNGFGVLLVMVVALALAQIAAIRERAVRDPLTGLYNRRYIDESLPGLLELDERAVWSAWRWLPLISTSSKASTTHGDMMSVTRFCVALPRSWLIARAVPTFPVAWAARNSSCFWLSRRLTALPSSPSACEHGQKRLPTSHRSRLAVSRPARVSFCVTGAKASKRWSNGPTGCSTRPRRMAAIVSKVLIRLEQILLRLNQAEFDPISGDPAGDVAR
jgi:hypothetical protein